MKRSPELRDLSEEHHYGLVTSRTLRLAAEGKGSLPDAIAAFAEQWEREIEPHFRTEEEVLLPAFTGEEGTEALIARTHREHAALRDYAGKLAVTEGEPLRLLAAETAQLLHDHIRFEERVLFPAIEAALAGERLTKLGERLQERERQHACPAPTPNAQSPTPKP